MNSALRSLINDVMIPDSNDKSDISYTHHTYFSPRQRLRLNTSEYEKFWTGYCDIVSDSKDDYVNLSLAEITGDTPPMVLDFKLRFPESVSSSGDLDDSNDEVTFSPCGEAFILSIVSACQQTILDNLKISVAQHELICCVMEPEYNCKIRDEILVSFKLQFPYCRTSIRTQNRTMRTSIIKYLRQMNVIKLLDEQPVNNWEDIIDKSVPENPWPLYRGITDPKYQSHSLTHIYGIITQDHIENYDKDDDPEIELEDAFFPTEHSHVKNRLIQAELFESNDINHWLPLFLSVNYWQSIVHAKEEVINKSTINDNITIQTPSLLNTDDDDSPSDLAIAIDLIPMLSDERKNLRHYWIEIGKALWNACKGGLEGLDVWVDFTRGSEHYEEDDCRALYPSFVHINYFTIKSIAWYAMKDSHNLYATWQRKWYISAIDKASSLTHTDVATAMYRIYWLEFICTSIKDRLWYQYEGHHWKKLDRGHAVRQKIKGDFLKRIEGRRNQYSQMVQDSNNAAMKDQHEIQIKKLTILIQKLKQVTFKNLLLTEAQDHFYVESFCDYRDTNINLMGIINGVIETCDGYAIYRYGKPEDYITMCSGIYWSEEYHADHPVVIEFLTWMHQCFPDPDLCVYFMRLIASCLRSGNNDKIFPIMTGEGNNSKSMVKKLIECIFGSYSFTMPSTFFTQTRGRSNQASPEIALAKYAKLVWMQEPNAKDDIMDGTLKELTGMDQIFARLLNENGGNFTVNFIVFLMCNKIPGLDPNKAIKNRTSIIPFGSTWVSRGDPKNEIDLPETEDEQMKLGIFEMDPKFEHRIPLMAPAALWVFVNMFKEYEEEGLKTPQSVVDTTEEYWNENDLYDLFKEECIDPAILPGSINSETPKGVRDANVKLTLAQVYAEFKVWYKENYPGTDQIKRDVVKYELEQRWGKLPRIGGWQGIRVKEQLATI